MKFKIIGWLLSVFWLTARVTTNSVSAQTEEENSKDSNSIPTRSYAGLGGNIGLGGEETALGDGGFSLVGRTAFSNNISLHTSTVFGDDNVGAFALTFGIPIYSY